MKELTVTVNFSTHGCAQIPKIGYHIRENWTRSGLLLDYQSIYDLSGKTLGNFKTVKDCLRRIEKHYNLRVSSEQKIKIIYKG